MILTRLMVLMAKYEDVDWADISQLKYTITRSGNKVTKSTHRVEFHHLAFLTESDRDLFYSQNIDLINSFFTKKQYNDLTKKL